MSVASIARPPEVRCVRKAVMPSAFRKSTSRSSMACASCAVPASIRLLIGSTITTAGLNCEIILWICTRCISRPNSVGREAWMRTTSFFTYGSRSMPMVRMLRISCAGDSSNAR